MTMRKTFTCDACRPSGLDITKFDILVRIHMRTNDGRWRFKNCLELFVCTPK